MLIFDPANFPPASGADVQWGYQLAEEIPDHEDDDKHREGIGRKVGSLLVCAKGPGATLGYIMDIAHELARKTPSLDDFNNMHPFLTGVLEEAIDELAAMHEAIGTTTE